MILSRRERYIVIGAVTVVGLLALDRIFLTPLIDRRQVINAQMRLASEEMERADRLFANRIRLNRKWAEMSGSALKIDGSTAESQIIRAVGDWALEAGLNLSSVKPERAEKEKQFQKITFRANATGNMAAVSKFLWRLQTSKVPIRVIDLSITTRRDGVDDLSLDLGISTLYLPPEATKPETASNKLETTTREDRI
ncbi:MAG TPA: GspMb/PilO family protein [Tepidisphaeraceae bacterium]|jgi:hypothetical protein|nr:GspMb/PilO family protein [Tepidisphaeraceae bacterium]